LPIFILIYFFLEIYVSIAIASSIGVLPTFLEIIFSAIAGFYILTNFSEVFSKLAPLIIQKQINFASVAITSTLAAVCLIIPGFLSDIIGIALLLISFINILKSKNKTAKYDEKNEDDVIDVEVIE
jgi:UPF0716 family protein affecting phage T7 exclusion